MYGLIGKIDVDRRILVANRDPARRRARIGHLMARFPAIGVGSPFRGLLLASALLIVSQAAEAQSHDVRGVWDAERYLLADGTVHDVEGQIFFAERSWQVLFFVMDESGEARRGSGEGGTYARTEDGVVFRHLFHLSAGEAMPGLPASALRMVARGPEDAPLEPTRVEVNEDVLTLFFPSGNRMTFRRADRP